MKLEEEIGQKNFRNEHHKLAVNLIFTHGWLMNNHNRIFKRYGITGTQFNILRILRGQYPNPASINLLKERMLDKMSDASRLVERLKNKGLVERKVCPGDRRKVEVFLTERGLKVLEELDKHENEMDELLNNLTYEEATKVNKLLDTLRK